MTTRRGQPVREASSNASHPDPPTQPLTDDCDHRRSTQPAQPLAQRGIRARIARRGVESSTRLGRHRYVIERCLEWVTRFRRLAHRYERKASHLTGFPRLACALIRYRRADRLNLPTSNDPK
ncbi:hypothetical protein Pen02_71100 [Plantactinospora endophytica]|uniref:Transposase DDE domain-containing protein n=1 Tax=Plantactinospora endophytica TaxID=673535 RepID=A0ABQ4EBU9_9ACTN|nr:hypothetical protein Pen02_71100 [Plantactinospora endophytica]